MERQQLRTEQMVRELSGPQNRVDPFTQMTEMMTAMGGMMGAMGINPQQPKTMLESLTEMKLMREMFSELGSDSKEGGDGNLMGLLTATVQNFGPLLGAALAAGQKTGEVNRAGIIQPPKPPLITKPPLTEDKVMNDEQEQLNTIRPQVEILLLQAKGGANPADVADFVIKNVPDDKLEELDDFISSDKCIDLCIKALPEVAEHKLWFEKWRDAMLSNLAMIFDDGEDKEPKEPELTDSSAEPIKDDSEVAGSDSGNENIAHNSEPSHSDP